MHPTLVRLGRGNITTHHGQINMLKHGGTGGGGSGGLLSYIRNSVKAGTYRTTDEIEEMNRQLADEPTDLRRVRWNVTRGSKIQDYPLEYEVLSMNPPTPFQPRMPLKHLRKQYNKYVRDHRPTDRLARNYLHKLQLQEERQNSRNGSGSSAPASADEYYRRLLGGNGSMNGSSRRLEKAHNALRQKSSAVQKSYAVAMKQYQLMQTQHGLSEKDALAQVEELLKGEDLKEKTSSRSRAETLQQELGVAGGQQDLGESSSPNSSNQRRPSMPVTQRGQIAFPNSNPRATKMIQKQQRRQSRHTADDMSDDTSLGLLYGDDQRAFEGMMIWTKRLETVPYRQWTVGASTALDHWIAIRVLGLSEQTWLALVEGSDPSLLGRGRDIVVARHALFPETMLDGPSLDDNDEDDMMDGIDADSGAMGNPIGETDDDDDLDALLANLAGWNAPPPSTVEDQATASTLGTDESQLSSTASEAGSRTIGDELQEWRIKHVERPYENWSEEDKKSFMLWVEDFVSSVVPDESLLSTVDLDETRRNLLSVPPQTKDEAENFWNMIRDETSAEILLQKLLKDRAATDDGTADSWLFTSDHPFWALDYNAQLSRLVNLGTISDIANEFVSEAHRAKFLTRYGDYLTEGVELDHLIPDPNGPIRASDLGRTLIKAYAINPDERFRLGKAGDLGSDSSVEASVRASQLYRAWNLLKAGRANYEEKMFAVGKLGLSYTDTNSEKKNKK